MSDNIHKRCGEIMAELGKKGEFEFWDEFKWLAKIKLEKRLKDILEDDVDKKYYLSDKMIKCLDARKNISKGYEFKPQYGEKNANCLTVKYGNYSTDTYIKEPNCTPIGLLDIKGNESIRRVYDDNGLCPCLTTMEGGNRQPKIKVKSATKKCYETASFGDSINLTHPDSKTRRGRAGKQVAQTLDCACNQSTLLEDFRIRKLTPRECFRLQDFPDTFKFVVSNSQLYKQAGNSISVNMMEMIFRQIEVSKTVSENPTQLFDFMGVA